MASEIIVYGHAQCPRVPIVNALLEHSAIDYIYIDIHMDEAARLRVREMNLGYESVPTLVFPDGTTLTEPSMGMLRSQLRAYGYDIQVPGCFTMLQRFLGKVVHQESEI